MGFQEEPSSTDIYHHLTKPNEEKLQNQKWTFFLVLCCLSACFGSFQFGYNIGSINTLTGIIQKFYTKNYLQKYVDQITEGEILLRNGEKQLEEGIARYNSGKEFYDTKMSFYLTKKKEFEDGERRRDSYMDIIFSMDQAAIDEAKTFKEMREKQIRKEHNMSVEEFMVYAKHKLEEGWTALEAGRVELENGKKKIENGTLSVQAGRKRLGDGKKRLAFIKELLLGITHGLFVIGGMIGAFTSKHVLDRLGRKKGILFHHMFSIIASVLALAAPRVGTGLAGPILIKASRLFFGIQGGMSCSLIPTYLSEVAPISLRGQIGVFNQLFLTIGIMFAQTMGFRQIFGSDSYWSFCLAFPMAPAILGFVSLLLFGPETPKALLLESKDEKAAITSLKYLRNSDDVSSEISQLYVEGSQMNAEKALSIWQLIRSKELRLPLLSGVVLQLAQQLCGINVVFFYSGPIFLEAGVSELDIQYAILLTGVINVASTVLCVPLIEKLGRKPLLVYPMLVMVVDMILLVIFMSVKQNSVTPYLSIMCILVFIVCFAVGLGPIPFIFVAEIFRQNARSSAMAVCVFVNWFSSLILILLFPNLQSLMGGYVFTICIGFLVGLGLFIKIKVPETKGRNVEEIIASFNCENEFLELTKEEKI